MYELIDPFWRSGHASIAVDREARSPEYFSLDDVSDAQNWKVTQRLVDPAGDLDWVVEGEVDVAASEAEGRAVLRLCAIRSEGGIEQDADAAAAAPDFSDVPDEDDLWAAYEEEEASQEEEEEEEEEEEK
jgi:hypothetical protein